MSSHPPISGLTRLPNVTLYLPLIYGSIAHYLGASSDQYATHRWRLYVRAPREEEEGEEGGGRGENVAVGLREAVKRVTFHLHPSFANAVRVVEAPNMGDGEGFCVEEDGWGEFEAMIKVEWNSGGVTTHSVGGGGEGSGAPTPSDEAVVGKIEEGGNPAKKMKVAMPTAQSAEEKPLVIKHPIRLYHPGTTHAVCGIPPSACATSNFTTIEPTAADTDSSIPVIHEFYDEVVFTEPTRAFYDKVMGRADQVWGVGRVSSAGGGAEKQGQHTFDYPAVTDLPVVMRLARAIKFIETEVGEVKDRIVRANAELATTASWMEEYTEKEKEGGGGGGGQ